jgi:ribosome recycling factor
VEELQMILDMTAENMQRSIEHLEKELLKVRAGRANPAMLEGVRIDYYGASTPLSQVANVNTPDARTLTVQPWEKGLIADIEKAILTANLGLNPQNNGEMVIINIPALTEERRKDLVKKARHEAEEARISIRNSRKEANDDIKKIDELNEDLKKDGEEQVQALTDKHIKKVDTVLENKEKDIMTV